MRPLPPSGARRIRRYAVTPEALVYIFTEGNMSGVDKGILPGARFCGFTLDKYSNCLFLFVEHPLFEAVWGHAETPEGQPITIKDLRQNEYFANKLEAR
jgi:hypothetical protein